MEHEHAARRDVRRPSLVVGERDVERVAAVDEHEPERRAPVRATVGESPTTATTTSSSPASSIVRRKNGSVSMRPVRGSTSVGVVVLPPGLVLLRATVVVDGEQRPCPPRACRRAQVDGRLPAVGADLEQRPDGRAPSSPASCSARPSSSGMKPIGGACRGEQLGVHGAGRQTDGGLGVAAEHVGERVEISPIVAYTSTASSSAGMTLIVGSAAIGAHVVERGVDGVVVAIVPSPSRVA